MDDNLINLKRKLAYIEILVDRDIAEYLKKQGQDKKMQYCTHVSSQLKVMKIFMSA